MKRLSKKVIELVNNYAGDLEKMPNEDKDFLIAQIDGLYKGFLSAALINRMWIEDSPIGEYTTDGQYCKYEVEPGLFAVGIYCLPIEGGKYLAIDYEIEDLLW